VRVLTNGSNGAIINTNSYSAFGLNAGETGKAGNTHRFAGEQLDPTGLYYDRARYYSPGIGRFIGRDDLSGEIAEPLTLNRFAYTLNNPLSYIDPSGFAKSNNPVERQITNDACLWALQRGFQVLCDIPSTASLWFVEGISMILTQDNVNGLYEPGQAIPGGVPRSGYGSRRDVSLSRLTMAGQTLAGGGPDILVLNDFPNPSYTPDAQDPQTRFFSGIYEVKIENDKEAAINQWC